MLLLYFMYFGFDRISHADNRAYAYNLVPDGIPLNLPTGRDFRIWLFNFSNFAAFLPYGMLIPLLFRCRFLRFLGVFLLAILMLEAVQMLTHLGSFDMDDVLMNSLGASVGFLAQRSVPGSKDTWTGMGKAVVMAILLSFGTTVVVAGINNLYAKATKIEAGRIVGLHELPLKAGSVAWDTSLPSFEVGGRKVEPQLNLFSRNNPGTVMFTYRLDGKYMTLSGYSAVPDDVARGESTIIYTVDGKEIGTASYAVNGTDRDSDPGYFESDLRGADELTVTVMNKDRPTTNVLLWDLTLTEIKP
ncbi:VanZ family protein [Cohnella sp. JJ-181]|uniref:VanZ family protein n=1 Tax=Cohnella rhizoplanae TaxID=2974897 RepID=UPI00232A8722|nr:VanZ family protein [Cohnella sp. JJ-181]